MKQYLDMAREVLEKGTEKKDRTGTGTLSIFGHQMRFNLQEGFPLVTTKKCHMRSIIHELLWFLKGETNIQYLTDNGVTIWDEWALKEDETSEYPMTGPDRASYALIHQLWTDGGERLYAKLNKLGEEKGNEFLDTLGVPRVETYVGRKKGDLGPVYGKQWRRWDATTRRAMIAGQCESIDQIATVMDQLKNDPDSRRIIVSAWNVAELSQMALAPCHCFFQWYTRELDAYELEHQAIEVLGAKVWEDQLEAVGCENEDVEIRAAALDHFNFDKSLSSKVPRRALSCQLYQRSADVFLGVPFNIASYALLIHMVAQQVNMVPDEFIWTGGDVHLYSNHLDQINEQLTREPKPLPKLKLRTKPASIFDYVFADFELVDYDSHPAIKAPVAV